LQEEIAPEVLQVKVPPLLLQPLVENAVLHGIANLIEGGDIRLRATGDGGWVTIVVEKHL